jgi:hypothetical protein
MMAALTDIVPSGTAATWDTSCASTASPFSIPDAAVPFHIVNLSAVAFVDVAKQ